MLRLSFRTLCLEKVTVREGRVTNKSFCQFLVTAQAKQYMRMEQSNRAVDREDSRR